jgi:GNAT superfamily N-acetyltransferase
VYHAGEQIDFARCVTDFATVYWLADVVIDERFRGQGFGKALVSAIVSDERLNGINGMLATRDAHALYARHGFAPVDAKYYMKKQAEK